MVYYAMNSSICCRNSPAIANFHWNCTWLQVPQIPGTGLYYSETIDDSLLCWSST